MVKILQLVLNFLNNNTGVVTFFVGSLAIYLYIKQKRDHKRDAASLILQEIRYAEQQIRNARQGGKVEYPLASKLLPTNSWNDNIHLFVKDLKETQIDMISAFYSKTTFVDFLISKRADQITNPSPPPQNPTPPPQDSSVTAQPLQQKIVQLVPSLGDVITVQMLTEISSSLEFLYNTPTVEKLRKISEKTWYQIA